MSLGAAFWDPLPHQAIVRGVDQSLSHHTVQLGPATSKLSVVVGRILILRAGLAVIRSLSRGPLRRAAHTTAAAFLRRGCPRWKSQLL